MKRYESYKPSGNFRIPDIPSHWETPKFYHLFRFIGGNGFPLHLQGKKDEEFPFYKTSDINGDEIYITQSANYVSLEDIKRERFTLIPQGAFLMSKIGAALRKNHRKITSIPCLVDNNLQALVKKPYNTSLDLYLYYFLKYFDMAWVDNNGTIPCVDNAKLKSSTFPIPPLDEQEAIVEYLDTKTSKIDTYIAEREKEISALQELKQAEIAHIVTQGLNPDVPMRDSGIPWLGQIPAHWKIIRIKHLFIEEDLRNSDLSYQLLTFSRKKGIIPFADVNDKMPSASDLSNYKVIKPGQLLENRMQAWSGMFAKSSIEGCVSPDYSVFSPRNENICVDYFAHLFRTNLYIAFWTNLSKGVGDGFNRLYTNQFFSVYAIVPPIEEQKAIVDYINAKTSKIDSLIADLTAQIEKLKEYKQRLIADVVTGQIDVRK